MNDLLERLRTAGSLAQALPACREAADVIERLLAELASTLSYAGSGHTMTLEDLAKETLVEKNRRLRRAKCMHEEIHISSVTAGDQTFTNIFCLDCGLSLPRPHLSTPEK